jgi:hypothetical protein
MPSYVLLPKKPSAGNTARARTAAEGAGLQVVSTASGAVIVRGTASKMRTALGSLGSDWNCAAERHVITTPERRTPLSPARRAKRA